MNKIGVLYSGISFQHQILNDPRYRGNFMPIDIYELPNTDLSIYDALIVPRSVDQVALNDYSRIIREYLDMPGIVIALGDYRGEWLPGCEAGGFTREDDEPLIKIADHPILNGLESKDLHWHKGINGLCSHGHLIPPQGINVLIKNQRGDAILYEDRTSTRGIIVAGTQFDIFCHCFSEDNGAITALQNVIDWIAVEAPGIRSRRENKKIGVVYSGLHFHKDLFTRPEFCDMEMIYIRHLGSIDLLQYNVLIVPRESNQEVLYRERDKLIRFLEHGRTILSFGEVIRPWLPGLIWDKSRLRVCFPEDADSNYDSGRVETDNLMIEEKAHSLFDGITLDDLKWHYHGVFTPLPGQKTLLSDGNGKAVILLDECSFSGKYLAMTLDPEEHAGFGEVRITEKFLERCMDWARKESDSIEGKA